MVALHTKRNEIYAKEFIIVTNEPIEEMLTVEDIMRIFHMGKNRAYGMMRAQGFPSIRINNRSYVTRSDLNDWIKKYKGKEFSLHY